MSWRCCGAHGSPVVDVVTQDDGKQVELLSCPGCGEVAREQPIRGPAP